MDCRDGSDENIALCVEGSLHIDGQYVYVFEIALGGIYCIAIYLVTGTLIYMIIDMVIKNKNGLVANGEVGLEDVENKHEEERGNHLDFLFDICKNYSNSVKKAKKLRNDHKQKIIDAYRKHHSEEQGVCHFFHTLMCLSLDPTFLRACQLMVDEIYRAEIDHHHCGNNERALLCIKQHLR